MEELRCRSARSSSTTRSARRRARVPGVPGGARRALARARAPAVGAARRARAAARARAASPMPPAHASCLAMLAPVMTMREGAAIYAPGGALLEAGDVLRAARARRRARARARRGRGVRLPRDDRATRSSRSSTERDGVLAAPTSRRTAALVGAGRGDVRRTPRRRRAAGSQRRPRDARTASTRRAATARCSRRSTAEPTGRPHDEPHGGRRGRIRMRADDEPRSRLGRLPARARPAPEQHARRDRPRPRAAPPGERMASMMAPTLVFDGDGLELAIGAAGGTRLRTAWSACSRGSCTSGLAAAGRNRPAALPPGGRARQRRARSRRDVPGAARGGRSHRPPLAGAATTTSAASARSAGPAPVRDPRRSGAVRTG